MVGNFLCAFGFHKWSGLIEAITGDKHWQFCRRPDCLAHRKVR